MMETTALRRIVSSALFLLNVAAVVSAFAPAPFGSLQHAQQAHQPRRHRHLTTSLNLVDPDTAMTILTTDFHHVLSSASQLLADASAAAISTADATAVSMADVTATVDATVAADTAAVTATAAAGGASELGWWGSYISLFKSSLLLVHSTIDGPLRNAGFDQTWGISIALFTFSIRSLLIPLSIQQSKSAEYMKALKPYTIEIKERFKNNENAMNRALAKLYEDANQNPLSGCLLSFAQIPIFLGLYRGVRLLAIDGKLEEPFLFIPSLEGPVSGPDYRGLDWLVQGWTADVNGGALPIPPLGWEMTLAFLVMPVVLVLLQSVTMNVLQPPPDDSASEEEKKTLESTQTFLKFLPLLIGFFSLQVPAGLTIYWFTSNIFTLSQSLAVRAYFAANPPNIELPEYWDTAREVQDKDFSEMTPEERRQATEMGIKIGPTMEDLIDEGRFHVVIERSSLRQSWGQRLGSDQNNNNNNIPEELQHWVSLNSKTMQVVSKTTTPHHDDKKNDKAITTETATTTTLQA